MKTTRDIRHKVRISATPRVVYETLMDSKRHSEFTGAPACIDPTVGGRFTAWGPHLMGVNVELIKNKRIVQAWRAENWPEGHYSIVAFQFEPSKNGTLLVFTQFGIPLKHAKSIDRGWDTHYWQLLKKTFDKRTPQ